MYQNYHQPQSSTWNQPTYPFSSQKPRTYNTTERKPSYYPDRSQGTKSYPENNRSSSIDSGRSSYRSQEGYKDRYSRESSKDSYRRDRYSRERDRDSHRDKRPRYRSPSVARSYRSRSKRRSKSRDQSPRHTSPKPKVLSEREHLLEKYRSNYCATSKDMVKKMDELSALGLEGIIENEKKIWTRTAPADLYYYRDDNNPKIMKATNKQMELCDYFNKLLLERSANAKSDQMPYEPPPRKTRTKLCRHKTEVCSSSSDSESSIDEDDRTMEELMAKKQHPQRLHPELWFNDPGEVNFMMKFFFGVVNSLEF